MSSAKAFFHFTRRERRGVLALLFLCFTGLISPAFFSRLRRSDPVDFTGFDRQAAVLEEGMRKDSTEIELFPFDPNLAGEAEWRTLGLSPRVVRSILNFRKKGGRFRHPNDLQKIYTLSSADFHRLAPFIRIGQREALKGKRPPEKYREHRLVSRLFVFDPNTSGKEDLLALGLTARTAALLLRYREKGGRFRKPEDLGKIYGLTETDVQRLLPFVRITESAAAQEPESRGEDPKPVRGEQPLMIDVNQADAAMWSRLDGIGPVLSERILKFREKLGGFARVEQVGETFGLADTVFLKIQPFLYPSTVFRLLAINRESWQGLSAHPYINQRQARAIVSYREQHGPFHSAADLDQLKALTPEWKEKMAPYWSYE